MTRCVREMLSSALTAFVNGDADLGRKVCRSDDQVDALHQAVFKKWISKMSAQPGLIDPAMEILRVSRNLERVADLATNVAEDVVFLVEGIMIAHHADEA